MAPGASVLDLCTGSGLLALAAAQRGAGNVVAVDVSRRAAATAWLNARLNGLSVTTRVGDLFEAIRGRQFDVIVANPPYLPGTGGPPHRFSAARAWHGGNSGREVIDRICDMAGAHLNPGGELLMVHSSVNDVRKTTDRLRARGLHPDVLARTRGPLGPLLSGRRQWLAEQGLLAADGTEEELAVICAVRGHRAEGPGG